MSDKPPRERQNSLVIREGRVIGYVAPNNEMHYLYVTDRIDGSLRSELEAILDSDSGKSSSNPFVLTDNMGRPH